MQEVADDTIDTGIVCLQYGRTWGENLCSWLLKKGKFHYLQTGLGIMRCYAALYQDSDLKKKVLTNSADVLRRMIDADQCQRTF